MAQGGKILVDALVANGVGMVFSVPGESYLAVLDGLYDTSIRNIVCRHEGACTMMAEAAGKLTGRPGIAMVTRGPGASNASAGVHVARQDSTPMILLIGQIARSDRDREAFQEVDYRAMFGPLAKWVAEIDATDRIPEYMARAFHVAMSGRPGPVVLSLPEDVLNAACDVPGLAPARPVINAPGEAAVEAVRDALGRAARPLLVAGGGQWSAQAAADLARFAAAWDLPVAVASRRQDRMDNRLPHYVGDLSAGMSPALKQAVRDADLIISLGSRLGDVATDGYTLIAPARPDKRIVMIHPDGDLMGTVWRPDPAIAADPRAMIAALAAWPATQRFGEWTRTLRAGYEDWQRPRPTPGAVRLEEIILWLSENMPEDAVMTNGAGNYAVFLHRYFRFKAPFTQLAPTSGSMGYGLPAAISAKLHHPGREVVCLAGDGCIQMTINELSTAAQHGVAVIVIIADNGQYGTIRMHQEKHYPGRVSGTALANPDYAALARAYGGYGETVTEGGAFAAAFQRARDSGRFAVITLQLDPEALTSSATLSEIRAAATAG
ncbi:MAG: thiamine pyrophosphate-binding protein [Paracoccus sp. (in: a-proteobacteria)]|nr:thiamine pyrophosphate-binding protein [Paracoccus sp. (in: a-proteobacteria)]